MSRSRPRHSTTLAAAAAASLTIALVGQSAVTASAAPGSSDSAADQASPAAGDPHDHLPDVDNRSSGSAAPSKAQRSAAAADNRSTTARGATGTGSISWNRFGSVATMTPTTKGDLATGLGSDPELSLIHI